MNRDAALLASLGALLEISLLIVYFFTGLNRISSSLETFFTIPYLVYVSTVVWITRSKPLERFKLSAIVIITVSIILYLTFILQTPTLSGDVYRYIWDGKLINNGISPYKYAPYANQLAYLRDSNWQLVENKDIISPYPPLLELINALVYWISPTVTAYKATTILGSIGITVVLPFLLKQINYDPRLAVLFAWNPLFILEFGSSGHDDTIALLFVALSIYFLLKNQRVPSAAMMGLGVISKLFPLLLIPIFLKKWGSKGTTVLLSVVIVFYAPFFFMGGNIVDTISVYVFSGTPIFNAGIFSLFQNLFINLSSANSILFSRVIEYTLFGALMIWMLWVIVRKNLPDVQLIRYAGILLSVYVALSSTIQPWYLAWIFVPFLVMMPTWSWIIFSGMVFLTYYTFTQTPIAPGYWGEILWVKIVEFAQLYGMIAYEVVSRKYFVPFQRQKGPTSS